MPVGRDNDPISRTATQAFGLAALGGAVLSIIYVMTNRPLQSWPFDAAAAIVGLLLVTAVWYYLVPRGLPAAVYVGVISVALAMVTVWTAMLVTRELGLDPPPWVRVVVGICVLASVTPWVVRRVRAAHGGVLLNED